MNKTKNTQSRVNTYWNSLTQTEQDELRKVVFREMAQRSVEARKMKLGAEGFRVFMKKIAGKGRRAHKS